MSTIPLVRSACQSAARLVKPAFGLVGQPGEGQVGPKVDDADLQEVYDTERHLLYVACTRARDHLLVTAVGPGSEFLEDLKA